MKIADLFVDLKLDSASFSRDLATTLKKASASSITVKVDADTSLAQAKIAKITGGTVSLKVDADATKAGAQIDRAARNREAKVKVDVQGQKGINFAFKGVSNLTTAIAGLGGSAIPILSALTAGVGALGSAFISAGGAGGLFAASVGLQVKEIKEAQKNINQQNDALGKLTKGTKEYAEKQKQVTSLQKEFNQNFGPTAKGLDNAKVAIDNFRLATGKVTLGVMGQGLNLFSDIMPRLVPLANAAGKAIGGLLTELEGFSKTAEFQNLLNFFTKNGPAAITAFGHIAGNVILGVINIFKSFAPSQSGLLTWLEDVTGKFRAWSATIGTSNGFAKWMDSVKANLPAIRDLIVNITQVIAKFVQGLGPLAQLQFAGMSILAEALNKLPPKAFTAIATAVAALVVGLKAWEIGSKAVAVAQGIASAATTIWTAVTNGASKAALGTRIQLGLLRVQTVAMAVIQKAAAVATTVWTVAQRALNAVMRANPIGIVITVITALVGAAIYAYKHFETFRRIVDAAWAGIKKAAGVAWAFIKSVFSAIRSWISGTLIPIFKRLWDFIKTAMAGIGNAIKWAWDHLVKPIFLLYKSYITNIVIPIIQRLWSFVKTAFTGLGNAIKWVWENVVKKAFDAMKKGVDLVRAGFKAAVDKIGSIWDGLKDKAKKPVEFVIDKVYNDGIYKLVGLLPGDNPLKKFTGFAKGGVLPGYSPGRDIHQFYSPTGGRLALSGGEAIMRPEWTKAVGGPAAVAQMNKKARVMHHAAGGIFRPVRSGSPGGIHDQWTGFPAVDVPVPSGTPVYAGASGRVVRSEDKTTSYGHWIQLAGHLNTLYAHLTTRLAGMGANVKGGNLIGYSGSTGNSTGPHLHFGAQGMSPLGFFGGSTAYTGKASGAGDDGGGHWWNIIGKLKDAISAVKDSVSGMGKSGWFGVMQTAAKGIGNQVVDWINDKIPNFLLPDNPIPGFAKGGIVSSPTLAMVGEAGPEAIIPFKKGGVVSAATAKRRAALRAQLVKIEADVKNGFDNSTTGKTLRTLIKANYKGKAEKVMIGRLDHLVRLNTTLTKINAAQKTLSTLRTQRADFVGSMKDTIAPNIGDFASTPGGILAGLRGKAGAVKNFATAIKKLSAAGFPRALVMQVAGLGLVEGANAANQLLALGAADKKEVSTLFNQMVKDSGEGGVAGSLGNSLFGGSIAAATKALKRLPNEKSVVKAMNKLGSQIVDGMIKDLHLNPPKKKAAKKSGGSKSSGGSKGGGGSSGGGGGGGGSASGGSPKDIARRALNARGWGGQWNSLNQLVAHESSWNPKAENPTSTASGLFQFLDSTARAYGLGGHASRASVSAQVNAGLRYIKSRYGNPNGAWSFWQKHRWYDNGGWLEKGRTMAVNQSGKPEAILTAGQWTQMERLISAVESGKSGNAPLIGHAVIRENVDLERYERQRAFRERRTRV